jgi:hypothetical protein
VVNLHGSYVYRTVRWTVCMTVMFIGLYI